MSCLLMHIPLPITNSLCTFNGRGPRRLRRWRISSSTTSTTRRCGNYKPSFWDFNYIQSLTTHYSEETYSTRVSELIVGVKKMLLKLNQERDVVGSLELIDDLQRLGISYHFHQEINHVLNSIYNSISYKEERDLYSTALQFRLLREHGFHVPQEVFDCFKNEKGEFRLSLGEAEDTRGVLQLYEASFLLTQGEETMEIANRFSTNFLHTKLDDELVRHSMELPIHWRIQRPNARWFIEAYEKGSHNKNPVVVELAKLDFNILQSIHQEELKFVSRWWKQTGISEGLPFVRDRVVQCYVWTLGGLFQPQYRYSRIMATKVNVFITIIDDIFDVYGTWEELQLFNDVIQRWDIAGVDQLPDYMQMCFLALNNLIDEMAYNFFKEQGVPIVQHLRKSWMDLSRSYTQEAKWYAAGYTPTLDEYMSNAWISISAPLILTHAYFLNTNPIHKEDVRRLDGYQNIIQSSSLILRLANDLGTSPYEMERGDVPKSVECYMNESGATVEEAREHVRFMIWETWKRMNQERVCGESPFSQSFRKSAVDLGRMAQYMYHDGDGHGIQNPKIKDAISNLLFEPIFM